MIRLTLFFVFVLLTLFVYLFSISQVDLRVVSPTLDTNTTSHTKSYRGVINVRTNRSNGSGDPYQVLQEASQAGLDWILLTDPFESGTESSDLSGYNGQLMVLDGQEINYADSRFLLASGTESLKSSSFSAAQLKLAELLSKKTPDPDTLLFLSQPDTRSAALPKGLTGAEIYNVRSIGVQAWNRSKLNVLWSMVTLFANPEYAFLRLYADPADNLMWWDQKLSEQNLIGIAGSEANAKAFPLPGWLLQFPSYQRSFEIFTNNVWIQGELTGNFEKDRQKIVRALSSGNSYMTFDLLGQPQGFQAALTNDRESFMPGYRGPVRKGFRIEASLRSAPRFFFEMIVFRNGERVLTSNSPEISYPVAGPGVYRIIVRVIPTLPFPEGKRWCTWITTNAFVLTGS